MLVPLMDWSHIIPTRLSHWKAVEEEEEEDMIG